MSILFLTGDLMFSSRVSQAAQRAGTTVRVIAAPRKLDETIATMAPRLVLLDMSTPGLNVDETVTAIRSAVEQATLIAYGPHVHTARLEEAANAGCDLVLSKGQFNSQLDELVGRHS